MKIDHINIVVSDLESAKEFFLMLGFIVKKTGMLEGEWIDKVVNLQGVKAKYIALYLPDKETNLELLKFISPKGACDPKIGQANQIGFRHMALEVRDIEKVVENLKSKGMRFFSEIQNYNNSKKLCYFKGPEGIILELAEYT